MNNNGGDMAREIGQAKAAIEGQLGVPILGEAPKPKAQVLITLLSDGNVNFQASGDEIITRFLLSKGVSIYEQILARQLAQQGAQQAVDKAVGE